MDAEDQGAVPVLAPVELAATDEQRLLSYLLWCVDNDRWCTGTLWNGEKGCTTGLLSLLAIELRRP